MQVIAINIPDLFVDGFKKLVDEGRVESRSAAVRTAIDRYIAKKISLVETLVNIQQANKPAPEPKPVKNMCTVNKGWATPTRKRVKETWWG